MLPFFGQEKVSVDANGRVKLCPRFIADFKDSGGGDIVLFSLPEGGVAIYPEETFLRMRRSELDEAEKSGGSVLQRRRLRFSGAMTQSEKISNQGRITIPHFMREDCGLAPNSDVVMVGIQVGIEIWSSERWSGELDKMRRHSNEKGEREMASDLMDSRRE
jgi:DNA-binding transcriptional regulator/RsmH inhibitor MraZ